MESLLEKAVYRILLEREKAREIKDVQRHRVVYLTEAMIPWNIDFSFTVRKSKELFYCEAKGLESDRYRLVKNLYRYYGQAPLEVWRGDYSKPFLYETIIPKGIK